MLATLALLPTLPACLHQVHFDAGPVGSGRIAVPQEQLAALKGPTDVLFVRAEGAPGTIAVRRHGSGYLALLALCTHRSCEVSALPQSYDCPCHGSRFDLTGEVLEGPAERPMARLLVIPDGAGVFIVLRGGAS
jgi:Rieske Fe-S protein